LEASCANLFFVKEESGERREERGFLKGGEWREEGGERFLERGRVERGGRR